MIAVGKRAAVAHLCRCCRQAAVPPAAAPWRLCQQQAGSSALLPACASQTQTACEASTLEAAEQLCRIAATLREVAQPALVRTLLRQQLMDAGMKCRSALMCDAYARLFRRVLPAASVAEDELVAIRHAGFSTSLLLYRAG